MGSGLQLLCDVALRNEVDTVPVFDPKRKRIIFMNLSRCRETGARIVWRRVAASMSTSSVTTIENDGRSPSTGRHFGGYRTRTRSQTPSSSPRKATASAAPPPPSPRAELVEADLYPPTQPYPVPVYACTTGAERLTQWWTSLPYCCCSSPRQARCPVRCRPR